MNLAPSTKVRASWLGQRYFFLPQIIAVFIFGPIAWMAFDRTPPLRLYDGQIIPSTVAPGQTDVEVKWKADFSGRDCPGYSQRELVDSKRGLWAQLRRSRAGVFIPDKDKPEKGTVTTPPLSIPAMAPGKASYKVTQFYFCNPLQMVLHWPIIQPSPYIYFEVAP